LKLDPLAVVGQARDGHREVAAEGIISVADQGESVAWGDWHAVWQ
jgi:hypothetical protein